MITTVLLDLDDTTAKSWSGANRKIAGEVQ